MSDPKRKPGDWLAAATARAQRDPQSFLTPATKPVGAGAGALLAAAEGATWTFTTQRVGKAQRAQAVADAYGKLVDGTGTLMEAAGAERDWFRELEQAYTLRETTFRSEVYGTFAPATFPAPSLDTIRRVSASLDRDRDRYAAALYAALAQELVGETREVPDPRRTDCYHGKAATLSPDPVRAYRQRWGDRWLPTTQAVLPQPPITREQLCERLGYDPRRRTLAPGAAPRQGGA